MESLTEDPTALIAVGATAIAVVGGLLVQQCLSKAEDDEEEITQTTSKKQGQRKKNVASAKSTKAKKKKNKKKKNKAQVEEPVKVVEEKTEPKVEAQPQVKTPKKRIRKKKNKAKGGDAAAAAQKQKDEDDGWEIVVDRRSKGSKSPRKANTSNTDGSAAVAAKAKPVTVTKTVALGDKVPVVIGRGGQTIKKLSADTGAKFDINRDNNEVVVSGTQAQVDAGVQAVNMLISDKPQDKPNLVVIDVGDKVRAVIGRAGSTIKKIQAETGARLDIEKESSKVSIYGDKESVIAAHKFVKLVLQHNGLPPAATEVVDLGERGVFAVVGKAGATIRALQESTGARLDIDRSKNTVRISGDPGPVQAAKNKVITILRENQQVSVTVELGAAGRGAIIGKGGAKIRELQTATGARLDVDRSGNNVVKITGTKQQVAAAKAKVEEILAAPEPAIELKEGEIAITIEVEEENVGSVIGRGGSTIKDIQDKTGAKLSIPRGGTTLTIHGPEESVNKAKEMVEEVLKKSRELNAKRAERESAAAAYAAEMAAAADADTSLEEGEIRPSELKNMKLTADEDDALDWGSTPTLGDAFGVSGSQGNLASTTGQWADSSINTSGW